MLAYVAGVRWVARPLQSLVGHTERIGRGDFSHHLTLGSGDTVEKYAAATPLGRYAAEQLRVLNALRDGEQPKVGEKFKTVE